MTVIAVIEENDEDAWLVAGVKKSLVMLITKVVNSKDNDAFNGKNCTKFAINLLSPARNNSK